MKCADAFLRTLMIFLYKTPIFCYILHIDGTQKHRFHLEPHMFLAALSLLLHANADTPEECPNESPAQLFVHGTEVSIHFSDTEHYYFVYWVRPNGEVLNGIDILDARTKTTWSATMHRAVAGDEVMILAPAMIKLDGPGDRTALMHVAATAKSGSGEVSCFEQISEGPPLWAAVFTE